MEKTLSEELTLLRRRKGWTQTELAKRVGLAVSTIGFYEQGRMKPSPKNLLKLAKALDANPDSLLSLLSKGKNKVNEQPQYGLFRNEGGKVVSMGEVKDVVSLPVLGHVHAGDPNIPDTEIIDVIKLPRRIARKADYALIVKGMSMEEEGILPDDVILVKMQNDADNRQIVIARIDDDNFTLKRLRKEKGDVWLEPANSRYKAINPPFEIVGRVVYLLKQFR